MKETSVLLISAATIQLKKRSIVCAEASLAVHVVDARSASRVPGRHMATLCHIGFGYTKENAGDYCGIRRNGYLCV